MAAMRRWREVNEALVLSKRRAHELMEETRQDKGNLQTREQQQTAVAELGQRALSGIDLQQLMEEAVVLLADILDVENTKILELLPEADKLLLRAGVGWKDGYVGHATVSTDMNSQAGYTLLSGEPVIVDNLSTETRFSGPPLLLEHGMVSGMSVIIVGRDHPFGVGERPGPIAGRDPLRSKHVESNPGIGATLRVGHGVSSRRSEGDTNRRGRALLRYAGLAIV
jgi:hypothetical protein